MAHCTNEYLDMSVKDFLYFHMGRFKERKFFLPLRNAASEWAKQKTGPIAHPQFGTFYFLTVGIGGDYQVEKEVKQMYPKCQIFGIEANEKQIGRFPEFGTAIPHAVGLVDGETRLKIRVEQVYRGQTLHVVPLLELLDTYMNGTRFIPFMTIDLEGYEYTILEGFFSSGILSLGGLVVCQIDAELHSYRAADFPQFWRRFLAESPYAPIVSVKFLSHRKVTFVHTRDKRCNALFPMENLL